MNWLTRFGGGSSMFFKRSLFQFKLNNSRVSAFQNISSNRMLFIQQTRTYRSTTIVRESLLTKTQQAFSLLERIFKKLENSNTISADTPASTKSQPFPTEKQQSKQVTHNSFNLVEKDLEQLKDNILESLASDHPFLNVVAKYYVGLKGKRFRPAILLILSRALACHVNATTDAQVSPKQLQLAEIIEMIHTASIIHDDVIDKAETRRGEPSINYHFGNKVAILSGDFLLARASIRLSWLENFEVTRLISTVIAELVEGELMQIKPTLVDNQDEAFQQYIDKTYKKTASLIANGCRSIAVLAGLSPELVEIATNYGKNLGLAFQVVDDLLDFTSSDETLGKPAAVDLSLGLATAPVLFARQEFPELSEMIERKFENEGDVIKTREIVLKSKGLIKTKELAQKYRDLAVEAIAPLHSSTAKSALIDLADLVLQRQK